MRGGIFMNVLISLSILISLHNDIVCGFDIEIFPDAVNKYLHNQVTVTCSLDNSTDANVSEVMLVKVSRGSQTLAILRPGKLTTGAGMAKKIQAEGDVLTPTTDTFLRVTVLNPKPTDAGVYKCMLYFLDANGSVLTMETSANLTVNSQNETAALKQLYEKVSELESQLAQRQNQTGGNDAKIEQLEKDFDQRISVLEGNLKSHKAKSGSQFAQSDKELDNLALLETRLKEQEEKNDNQSNLITRLNNQVKVQTQQINLLRSSLGKKAHNHVTRLSSLENSTTEHMDEFGPEFHEKVGQTEYFTAVHNKTGYYSAGSVFVYGDVIAREGQGYDGNTGVFTAPVAGYYLFQLSINAYARTWIYIDLVSSKGKIFLRLFAGNSLKKEDFSHGSYVAKLEVGEKVKPVIYNTDAIYASQVSKTIGSGRVTHFTGYLLRAL